MLQKRQAGVLRKEIEALLGALPGETGLKKMIKESLPTSRLKPGCRNKEVRQWSLLPLIVCEAISGNSERAVPLAASLELFKAAAEVFDDIEDADSSVSLSSKYGNAVAINAATAMLILAEKVPIRLLVAGVDDRIVVRVMDLNSYYSTACAGQHLDLSLPGGKIVSEKAYLKIAGMKSASAVECACASGALLATENQQVVNLFKRFGHNLGMASQIANDIQGVKSGTDILTGKVTLPVIYALAQTRGELHYKLETAFLKPTDGQQFSSGQVRDLLFRTGAIQYAAIKMEFYKQRAVGALCRANAAGVDIQQLKSFIE
jgi:geranylgeranyl diphosphate synthase type I